MLSVTAAHTGGYISFGGGNPATATTFNEKGVCTEFPRERGLQRVGHAVGVPHGFDGVGVRLGVEHERLGVDFLVFQHRQCPRSALYALGAMSTGCIDRA